MSLTVKVARARSAGIGPGSGDPGLFGFLGSAIKKVAGVAKVIPGPIGWAAGAVSKLMPNAGPRGQQTSMPSFPMQAPMTFAPQMPQMPKAGPVGAIQRWVPGGETGMEPVTNGAIGAPAGYHVNKTEYWVKDKDGNWTFVPKESRWVKNRRRNPLNPRAASKAIGRIEQLKRATARFSRITIRKKCCNK